MRKGAAAEAGLAALVDEHPEVIADVRGKGLMLGLKCVGPNTEFVAALRDEKPADGRRPATMSCGCCRR